MKNSMIILAVISLFVLVAGKSFSASSNEKTGSGIAFHQGTWNEALAQAKKENKLIFLDISASWCGPCKMLKSRTFPDAEVGQFYNSNFINVAVDGEEGEGVELAQKYQIRAYPSLIFVDGNGKVIAQTAGYHNAKEFLDLGKQIINR
jgi:thioredoxin 1